MKHQQEVPFFLTAGPTIGIDLVYRLLEAARQSVLKVLNLSDFGKISQRSIQHFHIQGLVEWNCKVQGLLTRVPYWGVPILRIIL